MTRTSPFIPTGSCGNHQRGGGFSDEQAFDGQKVRIGEQGESRTSEPSAKGAGQIVPHSSIGTVLEQGNDKMGQNSGRWETDISFWSSSGSERRCDWSQSETTEQAKER